MPFYGEFGDRGIVGRFFRRMEQVLSGSWAPQIAWRNDSNQETETYRWLGQVPMMREWVGGRLLEQLNKFDYSIMNKVFEASLRFSMDDLRRDKTTQMMARVEDLASRAALHWEKLVSDLINSNGLAYDGQNFFDTDHSSGDSGAQINALTATQVPSADVTTATAPTADEMAAVITEAIAYMYGWVDDKAEPVNGEASQFAVMVPTAGTFYAAAAQALSRDNLTSGATNPVMGLRDNNVRISLVPNPRLTTTTQLFVFRTDGVLKPFIVQEEVPVMAKMIASGSEREFTDREHLFGVEAVRNAGYGLWHHAARVTLS